MSENPRSRVTESQTEDNVPGCDQSGSLERLLGGSGLCGRRVGGNTGAVRLPGSEAVDLVGEEARGNESGETSRDSGDREDLDRGRESLEAEEGGLGGDGLRDEQGQLDARLV